MNTSITSKISQLQPVSCSVKNCFYNEWLIDAKNNPAKFVDISAEDRYIEYHDTIKKISEMNIKQKVSIEDTEIIKTLNKFIKDKVNIDFFDATFKHFKNKDTLLLTVICTLGDLLQDKLKNQELEESRFLMQYIKEKQKSIIKEDFYHCLFQAIKHNYTDIVEDLLCMTGALVEDKLSACWNSNYPCVSRAFRINTMFDFITKNIKDKNLVIKVMLNILLKTEYLDQTDTKSLLIIKLTQNKTHKELVDWIYKIVQAYINNHGHGCIFNLYRGENTRNIDRDLLNFSIEELDEKLAEYKDISPSDIQEYKKSYYTFKFGINSEINSRSLVSLYELIKDINDILVK